MSEVQSKIDRRGKNNPFFGLSPTEEVKALLSDANKGEKNPMFGRTGESNPFYGQTHSVEFKAKISGANNVMYGKTGDKSPVSKKVLVYSNLNPTILEHEFGSYTEAASHFNTSAMSINRYIKSGKLFQKQWILLTSK